MSKNNSHLFDRLFFIFILTHLLIFTMLPIMLRYNLPLDSLEGALWGHELAFGYDKNPYLNAWLTAFAVYLGGPSGWMIYLFSQLSVVGSFYFIYKLAKGILPNAYAFLAVLALEGMQYFNIHAIDFNDNTLELSLWAGTIYFFYYAIRPLTNENPKRLFYWLATGLFAGLSMMAKYYTLILLAPMAFLLISHREPRSQLLTLAPYLGLLTFMIVVTPHFIWLTQHDYSTVRYIFTRTVEEIPSSWNHLHYPIQFLTQQILVFLPSLILLATLFMGRKPLSTSENYRVKQFDKQFLLIMAFTPFLLTVFLSFLTAIQLHKGWGVPLMSLWTVAIFVLVQPQLSWRKIKLFSFVIFLFITTLVFGYSYVLLSGKNNSSGNFPGKIMAEELNQLWVKTYGTPLAYVAGSRWLGSNIQFYSTQKPAVLMEWNPVVSPWINEQDLRTKGALFVWNISHHDSLPEAIAKKYPRLLPAKTITFPWHRNPNLPPVQVGVAMLPPE